MNRTEGPPPPDADIIRLRPGMYVGGEDEVGIANMFKEVFNHAVVSVKSVEFAQISIRSLWPSIVIEDNGIGFPFDQKSKRSTSLAESMFENVHEFYPEADFLAGTKLVHVVGLGLAVVNALSAIFVVKSWQNGNRWSCSYKKGHQVNAPDILEIGEGVGNVVEFIPDPQIFKDSRIDVKAVNAHLKLLHQEFPQVKTTLNTEWQDNSR